MKLNYWIMIKKGIWPLSGSNVKQVPMSEPFVFTLDYLLV